MFSTSYGCFHPCFTFSINKKDDIKVDEGEGVTDVTMDVNHVHEDTTTQNPLELGKIMHMKWYNRDYFSFVA